jgi:hypothetical protein
MFSTSDFALFYALNIFILMLLYDFGLLPTQFSYVIIYTWKVQSRTNGGPVCTLKNFQWCAELFFWRCNFKRQVSAAKKGDKTDCSNYRMISLLPTSCKMLSNILLSRLSPYIDEIIGDHQCGSRRNRDRKSVV